MSVPPMPQGMQSEASSPTSRKPSSKYRVTHPDGSTSEHTIRNARCRWVLDELIGAGSKGITHFQHPDPNWTAYIHKLRMQYGIEIETAIELHIGRFAGHHARYIIGSRIEKLGAEDEGFETGQNDRRHDHVGQRDNDVEGRRSQGSREHHVLEQRSRLRRRAQRPLLIGGLSNG